MSSPWPAAPLSPASSIDIEIGDPEIAAEPTGDSGDPIPLTTKKKKKDCETVSLTDYHQACTRMARADYCGDGTPWTVPGTPIDIFDHLSPQIETQETKWPVEAEWTPDGAYCLDDIRQQADSSVQRDIAASVIERLAAELGAARTAG